VSNLLYVASNLRSIIYDDLSRVFSTGVPVWLYICNQAMVYKCPSRIHVGVAFLRLQDNITCGFNFIESLCRSTSIMGYNPWVPEGHAHVSSPETLFELLIRVESPNFDFFNLRLHITSTSYILVGKCNG
jgi:hypothetical protein